MKNFQGLLNKNFLYRNRLTLQSFEIVRREMFSAKDHHESMTQIRRNIYRKKRKFIMSKRFEATPKWDVCSVF